MPWVDRIPRTDLYIGGLHALYQKQELFKSIPIRNIVSVLDFDIYEAGHFQEFTHLQIKVDDDPNEDILQHFSTTNAFIDQAIGLGGSVFVHCAMGKSRSATIICAFLMWKYGVNAAQALEWAREGRGVCEPNPGFAEQLDVWEHMLKATGEGRTEIYQRWTKDRYKGNWYAERPRWSPKL